MSSASEVRTQAHTSAPVRPDGADAVLGEGAISMVVRPFDKIAVARMIAIVALALLVFSFGDGASSMWVGLVLLAHASCQPLIGMIWRRDHAARQAQLLSDLFVFVAVVQIAPEYYWLSVVVVASLLAVHAVTAPLRDYVPVAILAVSSVAVLGLAHEVPDVERITGIMVVLAAGHGAMSWSRRMAFLDARQDLLSAISGVGGLAYLVDLHDSRGIVDVLGDVEDVVGWTKEEWLTADHRTLIHPDDLDAFWVRVDEVQVGELIDRTARIRTSDGRWIWMRDMARIVMVGNKKYLRGFSIDITAQQNGLDRATVDASTDVLTGLRNRRWLIAELDRRRAQRGHHLVLIDLNRFKEVNDTLGHDAGDQMLRIVAERLVACLRPEDVVVRLGGDEFAILVDRIPEPSIVAATVDRIAWEVSRPVEINGVTLTTSIAAGVSSATDEVTAATALLRRADIAMYASKREGRSSTFFDDRLEKHTDRRSELSRALPDALANGDLVLHFQPIVDVQSGAIAGVEGLARWEHAEHGVLRPANFLEVLLMSERAGDFTKAMVRDAIVAAASLESCGHVVPVAVNLPVSTVHDSDFESWFGDECERHGVEPGRLVFEIAERDIGDNEMFTDSIGRLASLGVTISLDDFGAGHTTLDRLRLQSIKQLKLARGVVHAAATDERERTILRSVLALADELGHQVIAEGVEQTEQLDVLRRFGCRHAQGYLFGPPVPFEQMLARICATAVPVDGDGRP